MWEVPGTGIYTVATFERLAEAAARVEDFSSNINCLLYADPPMHALHRSTVVPELVAKRMAALEPDIIAITEAFMARALDGSSVDFMAAIGNLVPITVISRLIGFLDSDLEQLLRAAFDSTASWGRH